MEVIETDGVPAKLWVDPIESGALEQVRHIAALPFAFKHVAIMPDAHQGYGMPIGGVLATQDVVIPNAVGVDIGCGMCALATGIYIDDDLSRADLKKIMQRIRDTVPVGFAHQAKPQAEGLMPVVIGANTSICLTPIVAKEFNAARSQLGTLGGGNHFIEIQCDDGEPGNEARQLWIMIHSGSRNLGKQVADYYNRIAIALNKRWFSVVPKEHELAFLPLDTDEGRAYLAEMNYCVEFALANRRLMMKRVREAFCAVEPRCEGFMDLARMVNIAHNYAAMEHHFGHDVLVHRKGATRARTGEIGIIPGSQGTKSYIVLGLGNRESFESCSHGAGRRMGRNEARRTLSLEAEIARLNDQGIIHGIRHQKDLDEAAGAYKDITDVIRQQADLVEVVTELSPLAVIKG